MWLKRGSWAKQNAFLFSLKCSMFQDSEIQDLGWNTHVFQSHISMWNISCGIRKMVLWAKHNIFLYNNKMETVVGLGSASIWYPRLWWLPKVGLIPFEDWMGSWMWGKARRQKKGREGKLGLECIMKEI